MAEQKKDPRAYGGGTDTEAYFQAVASESQRKAFYGQKPDDGGIIRTPAGAVSSGTTALFGWGFILRPISMIMPELKLVPKNSRA
ncbi:MAG: hypothetical protein R3D26_15375 [Cyanobacteriota/Melainabacteria group bacterium]